MNYVPLLFYLCFAVKFKRKLKVYLSITRGLGNRAEKEKQRDFCKTYLKPTNKKKFWPPM